MPRDDLNSGLLLRRYSVREYCVPRKVVLCSHRSLVAVSTATNFIPICHILIAVGFLRDQL